MSGTWKEVAKLRFHGERFRDHALDLSAVTELRQFQKMVAETAKSLWRAAHPERERLPAHFEERTRLCLRRIEDGSATVPLEVYLEPPEQKELWDPEPTEVKQAIGLAYDVFDAIANDRELPATLPRDLVSDYTDWGRTLGEGEEIELESAVIGAPVRVNRSTRERLTAYVEHPHVSIVELIGECLEADVRQRRFQIWIDPQTPVLAAFDESHEALVTLALKDHRSVRIRIRGRAEYSPQGKPLRFIATESLELVQPATISFHSSVPTIEDELGIIWADVPMSEWNRLPSDLSENLDSYLYGTSD